MFISLHDTASRLDYFPRDFLLYTRDVSLRSPSRTNGLKQRKALFVAPTSQRRARARRLSQPFWGSKWRIYSFCCFCRVYCVMRAVQSFGLLPRKEPPWKPKISLSLQSCWHIIIIIISCHTGFLSSLVLLLLSQWWTPPLRLQVSACSTFLMMCDVPSMTVFCRESIECCPGIVSRYFCKLLLTIPVAPMITGMTNHFMFHILW